MPAAKKSGILIIHNPVDISLRFQFLLICFEEFMLWETEIRFEDLVRKEKHTTNLVEVFMERFMKQKPKDG